MNRFSYFIACTFYALIFSTASVYATNYYTLNDGDFTNATTVWSTDGVNPCGCLPPSSFSTAGDSIFIQHNITLNAELNIENTAHLSIAENGLLAGTAGLRVNNNGSVSNAGNLNPNFLFVFNSRLNSTGSISTSGSFLNSNSTSDISGSVAVGYDFRNMNFGTLILRTNTAMTVNGFFFNVGTLITEGGVCINVAADFFNPEIGMVIGDGHISAGFNITNNGAWDVNTGWCATVSSFGMPTAPTCITCGPLPVSLASFDAIYQLESRDVRLVWNTASEVNNERFVIERSLNGADFTAIGEVESEFVTGKEGHYEWTDASPAEGINYYRLRQIDRDGRGQYLETTKVYVSASAKTEFLVYPNLTDGPVNYQLALSQESASELEVLDLMGRVILQQSSASAETHLGSLDLSHLDSGSYLVRIKAGTYTQTERVIKF